MSESEIDSMVNDAEAHKAEDQKRRKEIDTKHRAETLVYSTEKILNESREKIPAADASAVDRAVADLKSAIESNDISRIEREAENLTKASHKPAEAIYRQTASPKGASPSGASGRPNAGPSAAENDDDVVDAEFQETV